MSGATPPSSAPTICCPGNIRFYELSMKLWEGLEQDLNYNAMVSQRGVLNLFHSDAQRDAYRPARQRHAAARRRRRTARRASGARGSCPFLDFDNARFPIHGGLLQRRGGTARHDAVAWGYARAADAARRRHHPELRGHRLRRRERPHRRRRDDARARSAPSKVGLAVAGNSLAASRPWRACGCRSRATCCRPSSRRASSR